MRGKKERARRRLRALETAACQPGADFELWYGDGVRFDLLPVVRQMWRKKGQRLLVDTPGKNERVAVCGAYRFPDGPFRFSHQPRSVNSVLFVALVRKLRARAQATGKRIVLVLDNDGAFTSKLSTQVLQAVEAWVRPFWLPKYTSEKLNPIESLWGHLKEAYFSRMLTKRREDFYAAVVHLLEQLSRPGGFRSLFSSARPRRVGKDLPRMA
jgi:transposase